MAAPLVPLGPPSRPPSTRSGPLHRSGAHAQVMPRALRLTRYLPSGENLQSRPESLNDSEKFMAAASRGQRRSKVPPATAAGRGRKYRGGSKLQPMGTSSGRAALWGGESELVP